MNTQSSIRGSQTGELISRCIVETGTSSYYTALADACEEPVLKSICRHVAADELRHYKLFYADYLKRYIDRDKLNRFRASQRSACARIGESEDDELAYAYYAANAPENEESYDHKEIQYDLCGAGLPASTGGIMSSGWWRWCSRPAG